MQFLLAGMLRLAMAAEEVPTEAPQNVTEAPIDGLPGGKWLIIGVVIGFVVIDIIAGITYLMCTKCREGMPAQPPAPSPTAPGAQEPHTPREA